MSAIQAALSHGTSGGDIHGGPYNLRSSGQLERDKRVGAAGELFVSAAECHIANRHAPTDRAAQVFELLSRLNPELPGFSRANWQSTIRSYATSHPEYSDMDPWNGRETADITYTDGGGALASLLIDKGYLDAGIWAGARLTFFIEVKTTTGPCETPFYMSKKQYKMVGARPPKRLYRAA